MDMVKLHRAASEAALFQRAALAHLSHGDIDAVTRHGEQLLRLLTDLGFKARAPALVAE